MLVVMTVKQDKMASKKERNRRYAHPFALRHLVCCMMPSARSAGSTSSSEEASLDPDLEELLGSLEEMETHREDGARPRDLQFLKNLFHNAEFQSLLKVHEKVTTPETQEFLPLFENSIDMANQVIDSLGECPTLCEDSDSVHGDDDAGASNGSHGDEIKEADDARELQEILCDPHLQALLSAHDQIAAKDYHPRLPDIPFEVDEDEESVKIVRIVKGATEPLGATIHFCEETGGIRIARVMRGGAADRSGLIHIGDEVHEVNGDKVTGKAPDEVVQMLSNAVGPITLKLVPGDQDTPNGCGEIKMHVRALFSYDPKEDKYIPCKEAGLRFHQGDILHIVSKDDDNWWQARRENDKNMRAGLIPGKLLQESKEAAKITSNSSVDSVANKENKEIIKNNKGTPKFSPKLSKKPKKPKKILQHTNHNEEFDREEIFTYEEVERLHPKENQHRPIVLVGPPGVGRSELKKELIASNPDHFKGTIPHTTRSKKAEELEGEEYFFTSKVEMEKDIVNKKFVEYGEYKGNLYGTSMEQVKSIINTAQVCVLTPHPQALKSLRIPEVKPYIVFIKPPPFEQLKQTRMVAKARSSFDEDSSRAFTDEELKDMIQCAIRLEANYKHSFDRIVVNEDLQQAVEELCSAASQLETTPQWVPVSWVR